MRQAPNYAVDRYALAHAFGGDLAEPVCHLLPPETLGSRPFCSYTVEPGARSWQGTDLGRAIELIRRSGTRRAHVSVLDIKGSSGRGDHLLAETLERLGFRVSVDTVTLSQFRARIIAPNSTVQLALVDWIPDYPSPAAYFVQFACPDSGTSGGISFNVSHFCDPALDRTVARAIQQQASSPSVAAGLWAAADRRLMTRAPLVPLFVLRRATVTSRRVGNYQSHLLFTTLLDQLWVKN